MLYVNPASGKRKSIPHGRTTIFLHIWRARSAFPLTAAHLHKVCNYELTDGILWAAAYSPAMFIFYGNMSSWARQRCGNAMF